MSTAMSTSNYDSDAIAPSPSPAPVPTDIEDQLAQVVVRALTPEEKRMAPPLELAWPMTRRSPSFSPPAPPPAGPSITPPDLISIAEAARIAGMTEAWLIRTMAAAGVTRIGANYVYVEFVDAFRNRARQRQRRRAVVPLRRAPATKRKQSAQTKGGSVMTLVRELTKNKRSRGSG